MKCIQCDKLISMINHAFAVCICLLFTAKIIHDFVKESEWIFIIPYMDITFIGSILLGTHFIFILIAMFGYILQKILVLSPFTCSHIIIGTISIISSINIGIFGISFMIYHNKLFNVRTNTNIYYVF